ncbi:sporulation protein YtxC [Aquibacillus rhizosphaerae]|uniref:Sporulation protein YtxC n=1 Tax=Aquibacillus rhizosphaerae TaxID=3051431 RepID=A0ABT7L457_9BACI|nr:sporulation protein YtxC [Aquibacillus sp. LR5S19]MDL4840644.1 sporulation protein YtxC [Aquibacillus sp. LR5S19]
MLEVNFEYKKEAITFCERLIQYDKHFQIRWNSSDEFENKVQIETLKKISNQKELIALALADVFIFHRELNWVNHIVKRNFYYTDKTEIQRIIDLTQSIISGDDDDLGQILKDKKPRDMLMSFFQSEWQQKKVHFDSIVNFRMQAYRKELINVVGLAIDEFKREEEYQLFVHSLREYVAKKKSKCSVISIVQGENFTFFTSNGTEISEVEIKGIIENEPIYIVGLDKYEMNLTPLIAMAPKKIVIYGDDPSEPKTMTIVNIFQERVNYEPLINFPFFDEKI